MVKRVVTLPLVISSIGTDLFNLARSVSEPVRQDFGVADIVGAGNGADDFQAPQVQL